MFVCFQGTGPSVPKYLSFDGPVRNRRLGKRDTLLLIRDIWREKAASDAEVRILGSRFLQQWGFGGVGVGVFWYTLLFWSGFFP